MKRFEEFGFDTVTNIMAAVAAQAVYQNGAQWLDSVLEYIWNNYVFLKTTLSGELPWAKVVPLEGTFLAWIDLSASGLNPNQLSHVVRKRAKLMLFEGHAFGDAGQGFMRINLACPQETLHKAVKQLVNALNQAKESPPRSIEIIDKLLPTCRCCN